MIQILLRGNEETSGILHLERGWKKMQREKRTDVCVCTYATNLNEIVPCELKMAPNSHRLFNNNCNDKQKS